MKTSRLAPPMMVLLSVLPKDVNEDDLRTPALWSRLLLGPLGERRELWDNSDALGARWPIR